MENKNKSGKTVQRSDLGTFLMRYTCFFLTLILILLAFGCKETTIVNELPVVGLNIASIDPELGGPGMAIEIEGSGFSGVATENMITFDGIIATVEAASPTRIIAVVPEGVATGPVNVQVGEETAVGPVFALDERLAFLGEFVSQDFEMRYTRLFNGNITQDTTFSIKSSSEIDINLIEKNAVEIKAEVKKFVEYSHDSSLVALLGQKTHFLFVFNESPVGTISEKTFELHDTNFNYTNSILSIVGEFMGEGTLVTETTVLFKFSYALTYGNTLETFAGEATLQKQ